MPTLSRIRTKVRRLTRSPSENQLSTANLDEYIDDFVLYDFPEHLRLFSLREQFSFICDPFVDEYDTDANATVQDLIDFKDDYITVHQPVYIAGSPAYFSQDRTEFFAQFPTDRSIVTVATGDGATMPFNGILSDTPITRGEVLFASITAANAPLKAIDDPQTAESGNLVDPENNDAVLGTINYVTGVWNITFPTAPGNNQDITAHTLPYVAQEPTALLYFDNKFILRPIPDKPYEVSFEVYKRPTSILGNGSNEPELTQWWQYIAYGAAKKVLEDRNDMETVQLIMPEFKQQELLVQRRTIVQQTEQRAATIYQFQTGLDGAPWDFGNRNF